MKLNILVIFLALIASNISINTAVANDEEEMMLNSSEELILPASTDPSSSTPPVIIDDSDANDVSDVEEYDG